ncbi:MAG: TA system VapC family ribonuclease toxin, partial [Stellaceae bacterium]
MLVVDTNVLVYAANAQSPFHAPCSAWLQAQRTRPDAWYTTWPILYEFLRVATHPSVLRPPWSARAAWEFVAALLASPGLAVLVPTERHPDVAQEVINEMPH